MDVRCAQINQSVGHWLASWDMPKTDPEGRIFLSAPTNHEGNLETTMKGTWKQPWGEHGNNHEGKQSWVELGNNHEGIWKQPNLERTIVRRTWKQSWGELGNNNEGNLKTTIIEGTWKQPWSELGNKHEGNLEATVRGHWKQWQFWVTEKLISHDNDLRRTREQVVSLRGV